MSKPAFRSSVSESLSITAGSTGWGGAACSAGRGGLVPARGGFVLSFGPPNGGIPLPCGTRTSGGVGTLFATFPPLTGALSTPPLKIALSTFPLTGGFSHLPRRQVGSRWQIFHARSQFPVSWLREFFRLDWLISM